MGSTSAVADDSFVKPDAKNLENLAPGCFVQVKHQSQSVWVEITEVKGEMCQGILYFDQTGKFPTLLEKSVVDFNKQQITALGCDRYCYCD